MHVDLALPFGLRSAPGIFNTVADLFEWILIHNWSVEDLLHYLDDYFTLGAARTNICANRLAAIEQAVQHVGIPLSPEKCEGPTTRIIFSGIELDSIEMSARLPAEKLAELINFLREWRSKKSCKPKELQSLVGKLNHACSVIPCGRTFLRRLIDLLKGVQRFRPFLRLNKQCQLDIEWWQEFLVKWWRQNTSPVKLIGWLMPCLVGKCQNFFRLAPQAQPTPKLVKPELLARLTSIVYSSLLLV